MTAKTTLVVEDDPITRLIQVVLDPSTSPERRSAFADFVAHDVPDFSGWCERVRARAGRLNPVAVHLVATQQELGASMERADVVVVESLQVRGSDIAPLG